jgi:thiamine-phosphate pyrophosphorylase
MVQWRGYYAILDLTAELVRDVDAACARALQRLAAGPCCLQVRAKGASAADLLALGHALLPLARSVGVPLCINDRLDVALALGADFVHLGQDDLPLGEARRVAGGRLGIGISTHTRADVDAARAGGADYLGFGPIHATATKTNPDPVVGLTALAEICRVAAPVPVVAIGGITLEGVGAVARAGAAAAALISAIDRAADPALAGQAVNRAFRAACGAAVGVPAPIRR